MDVLESPCLSPCNGGRYMAKLYASHGFGPSRSPAGDRLDSWKEIAAHLNRDVRTLFRWEAQEKLPVYRHLHKGRSTVYAYRSELDAWRASRQPHRLASPKRKIMLAVLPFTTPSPVQRRS
jgi:hypothetical protein